MDESAGIGIGRLVRATAVACLVCSWPAHSRAQQQYHLDSWLPRPSSYMQLRYTARDPGPDQWAVRRLKLMLDGGRSDTTRYHIQLIYKTNNISRTDDRVYLQDAFFRFPGAGLLWTIGQFKPPFGLERFQPDQALDFVDRTATTERLIPNGRLGESFTRDRGVQLDYKSGGFGVSMALFQGGGANNSQRGNGPLGTARLQYGWKGSRNGRDWSWKTGLAASARRAEDLDLRGQLLGLPLSRIGHFNGRDRRINLFTQGEWGRLRGQAELFRAWFDPRQGRSWTAEGIYGQLALLPARGLIMALRSEWMTPDVDARVPTVHNWTAALVYDFPKIPLRLSTDYAWHAGNRNPQNYTWRFQIQYILVGGAPATH